MQPFSFFFCWLFVGGGGGGGISGRVRALNLTAPLGSGRVGSDNLGYGPGSGFSFEPVQTSSPDPNGTLNPLRLPLRPHFHDVCRFDCWVEVSCELAPVRARQKCVSRAHNGLTGGAREHPSER